MTTLVANSRCCRSFFPAVTVVPRGGCIACFEDFSVLLLNYGL